MAYVQAGIDKGGRRRAMSYEPKLAAALSGATLRQLSHWRRASGPKGAVLVPAISSERPILYCFRDVVALRIFVQLREEPSLDAPPPRLAEATLSARLADLDSAAVILAESAPFV